MRAVRRARCGQQARAEAWNDGARPGEGGRWQEQVCCRRTGAAGGTSTQERDQGELRNDGYHMVVQQRARRASSDRQERGHARTRTREGVGRGGWSNDGAGVKQRPELDMMASSDAGHGKANGLWPWVPVVALSTTSRSDASCGCCGYGCSITGSNKLRPRQETGLEDARDQER